MLVRRRFISFLLSLLVVVGAGCGGGGGSGGGSSSSEAKSEDSIAAPATSDAGAPTIQGQPAKAVQAGEAYSFQPVAQGPEGVSLTFSVDNLPAWASFDATTGRLYGSPDSSAVGTYGGIAIVVSDGSQSARLGPFEIQVLGVGMGVATISWTPPVSNIDGSALTNLAGYRLTYGRAAGDLPYAVELKNASINRYDVEGLAPGTWYFAVAAINSEGTSSVPSSVVTKTIS